MDGFLWGHKAKFRNLFIAAFILLFTLLGGRELWTQEFRWANIVSGMLYRGDFLHPYLGGKIYYDKPLLSYWFMMILAKLRGSLTIWELRLPSALSGLLTICCVYRLGLKLKDKSLGLLAGWMLLTTYYFVFWSRISSADMLNVAGSLLAMTWYIEKRDAASFFDYAMFFLIIAITSLCKGLIGAMLPCLAVFADIILQKSWKKYLNLSMVLSVLPAIFIYFIPFFASAFFANSVDQQNGLYLVYRENILRYFEPFDHQGTIYTYFIYLPIYLLPWSIFFMGALLNLKNYKTLPLYSKWLAWTLLLIFLFFTSSGSRRSYYVLPMVPLAILFTADWLLFASSYWRNRHAKLMRFIIASFIGLFLLVVLMPKGYYASFGVDPFAQKLKKEASKIRPWADWNVVLLSAENKLGFYLQCPPNTKDLTLVQGLSTLKNPPTPHTIFVSQKRYVALLQSFLPHYRLFEVQTPFVRFLPLRHKDDSKPVAFIPN